MTFTTENYTIKSHGNGWAYTVTAKADGRSFFVQDDDAAQLQADTNDFENEYLLDEYMNVCGE